MDQARTYFLCGGVPLYLNRFSDRRSVGSNIATELLDEYAPLYREADFLLREELREVTLYYGILTAIAAGHYTVQEIARQAGQDPRGLSYYLQQLIELGYIERRYALTGEPPSARSVRYDLANPLLRFWFRFVFPSTNYIRHMGADRALRDLIRPHLEAYFGHAFERLCREALPLLYRQEGLTAAFEVGEYWSKTTQIDVVGLRDDGWADLGECKWGKVRSAREIEQELEEKIREFSNPGKRRLGEGSSQDILRRRGRGHR